MGTIKFIYINKTWPSSHTFKYAWIVLELFFPIVWVFIRAVTVWVVDVDVCTLNPCFVSMLLSGLSLIQDFESSTSHLAYPLYKFIASRNTTLWPSLKTMTISFTAQLRTWIIRRLALGTSPRQYCWNFPWHSMFPWGHIYSGDLERLVLSRFSFRYY